MTPLDVAAPALVEAQNLQKVFQGRGAWGQRDREVHAVRNVSFSVHHGGSLAIVGESGSGKTTVARMIVGSESPTSGQVLLAGRRCLASASRQHRLQQSRVVQMVFQDPYTSLDPRQSLRAALDEVQRVHFSRSRAERASRTRELAEAVGLGDREMRALPSELSGGERQRAAIARSLAAEPAVIVLDEALSALDVSVQAQILNTLADLREQFDLTYILISHDLAVVRQLCDDIVVMYRGEVMETGPSDAVFGFPAHRYTRRLLGAVPRPGMKLARHSIRVSDLPDGCAFRARCEHADETCKQSPSAREVAPGHRARCWHPEFQPLLDAVGDADDT